MTTETVEQVTDGGAPSAEQEDSEFSAGFGKVRNKGDAPVTEKQTAASPAAAEPPKETVTTSVEPAKDKWEGVHPVIRETFDGVNKRLDDVLQQLRSTNGRVGAVQNALHAAKSSAAQSGAAAPTSAEVTQAASSPESWKKLESEFPEFAKAFNDRLAEVSGKFPKLDPAGLKNEVFGELQPLLAAVEAKSRSLARIDAKHEGWEELIKTPEFHKWAYKDGPTEDERQQLATLESTAADKAATYQAELIKKYPQWYSERGSLMDSDKASDAIKLLDAFKKASIPAPAQPEPARQQQQRRLEGATVPQSGGSATPVQQNDSEADFEKGFKKVIKKS